MKVCFINPPFKSEYGKFSRESRSPSIGHSGVLYYPLWLIYAAALAEQDGFEIAFIDAPAKRLNEKQTMERVKKEASDTALFVLDTSTPSIYSDVAFGAKLKKRYPRSKVMLVGTHPSVMDVETLEMDEAIDFAARREYDGIVLETARALRDGVTVSSVKGLTYRNHADGEEGSVIRQNPDADYIEDLDRIPMAAPCIRKYLDVKDYVFPAAAYPAIQIFTGRGCPAHCSFCVYPQTLHGHRYRLRTPEHVAAEFRYIADHFPEVHEVVIEDDTFTANRQRVLEICSLLIRAGLHKRLRWLCNARVNLDLETMRAMKKAGCHLMIHACYMVGNQGETRQTMETTLRAAMRFKTDTAQFFPLIPYPGTEAYEWAKKNGYISGRYEDYLQEDGTLNCVLNTPELSAEELVGFCSYARRKYYLRPWYLMHRLWRGLRDPEDLKRSWKAFWRLKDSLLKG